MQCPKCQFENPEGAKFCGNCKGKLFLVCPECGTENSPRNKYCDECAHELRRPTETPPLDYSEP